MAKVKRRSFGKFLRGAVKDVVVPTSMGLGLALGGCGSSDDKPDSLILAVLPPLDGAVRADGPSTSSDARPDTRIYAIMPPRDAAVDRRPDTRIYAIMPIQKDAGADARDTRRDTPIYAIMPIQKDAAGDEVTPDAESAKRDAKPDAKKTQNKDVGPIYAIMPRAILPPRG